MQGYVSGKVLIVNVDDLDFNSPEDLSIVIEKVNAEVHGLF
jgi:hypothetical protein